MVAGAGVVAGSTFVARRERKKKFIFCYINQLKFDLHATIGLSGASGATGAAILASTTAAPVDGAYDAKPP